jgi:hypothetical protein
MRLNRKVTSWAKYILQLSLIENEGVISAIEIKIRTKFGRDYLNEAMKKCYGEGEVVNKRQQAIQISILAMAIWCGPEKGFWRF